MIENFQKLKIFYNDLKKFLINTTKGKKLKLVLGFFVNIIALLTY